MKSLLITLFNTKKGLRLLDEEYEDDLFKKSILIFSIYGMISFFLSYTPNNDPYGYLLNLSELLIFSASTVASSMLITYILFQTGIWLKGKSNYTEIFSLFSYAYLPVILGQILVNYFTKLPHISWEYEYLNLNNIVISISYLLFVKTLVQGLEKFNKYGWKKAIINVLILISISVGFSFILYHIMLALLE